MTVVGPSLTWADAYATTAFIKGIGGLAWVARHDGYVAYGITEDDRVLWTGRISIAILPRPDGGVRRRPVAGLRPSGSIEVSRRCSRQSIGT